MLKLINALPALFECKLKRNDPLTIKLASLEITKITIHLLKNIIIGLIMSPLKLNIL